MSMPEGIIYKALSGFYYVNGPEGAVVCKARGHFRHDEISPLVGDRVEYSRDGANGIITHILERCCSFSRPAVANIDVIVIVASETVPVTDPFLIDRMTVAAALKGCDVVICINKSDSSASTRLYDIYSAAGFKVVLTSAVSGLGIEELRSALSGKVCALTGNSGVGKSSLLNALMPGLALHTGEVSEKLGRGRHVTRHVELFDIGGGTYIADTPGFAAFDTEKVEQYAKDELQYSFTDFEPYLNKCRYSDCAHIKEPGCAILNAVSDGRIQKSRHDSYVRLYDIASRTNSWEIK